MRWLPCGHERTENRALVIWRPVSGFHGKGYAIAKAYGKDYPGS